MNNIFIIEPDARVTYINKLRKEYWPNWKLFKDCSDEEKQKINLASYPKNCILFDRDLPNKTEEEIHKDYEGYKAMLIKRGIKYFYSYHSPHGYHILTKFENLDKMEPELRREVKKYYVSLFESDPAKISDKGVVSLPGKPHFKNSKIYNIFENVEGMNKLNEKIIITSKENLKKLKQKLAEINLEFKNYFEKDSFFTFIKTNIIPDNTNRDMTIFPNLAVASIKTGKSLKEIKTIIEPIIKKNFPGKSYSEFFGWLKKAQSGEIQDYNPIQLNQWSKNIFNKQFYDLTPIQVEELKEESNGFKFYWDKDLDKIQNTKTIWIIDKWLPKGDICFVAGKAASFKSTIGIHMCYAISEGKLVFNKYSTIKSKVLYLNEENSKNILLSMINRVKNGIDLGNNKSENIAFSVLENIKIDSIEDLNQLIKFINKHKIELVVFDSFRRFISFDENNATEMNRLFNNLKMLRKKCNDLTIILLHHLKKDNAQYSQDLRDMLRGSSDIVNSADSIIGIRRKHGFNAIQIEHIKNRSGEEITNKLILIDSGDNKNKAYFYESDKEMDKTKIVNEPERCANAIIEYCKKHEINIFARKDLINKIKFSYDTITKGLKILENDMTITAHGSTKDRKFQIVKIT